MRRGAAGARLHSQLAPKIRPVPPPLPAASRAGADGRAAWPAAGSARRTDRPAVPATPLIVPAVPRCHCGGLLGTGCTQQSAASLAEFAERAQPGTCKCPDKLLPANRNRVMESSTALPQPPRGALRELLGSGGSPAQRRGRRCGCLGLREQGRDAAACSQRDQGPWQQPPAARALH